MSCVRIVFLLCTSFVVASCSLMRSEPDTQRKVEIRDVPKMARLQFSDQPRQRIMVLPFIDVTLDPSDRVAYIARRVVVHRLNSSGKYMVITNSDFPGDINKYKENETWNLKQMANIAKSLGVRSLMQGRIIEVKANQTGNAVGLIKRSTIDVYAKIHIKVIGTENGKILLDETRTANVETTSTRLGSQNSGNFLKEDPSLVRNTVLKAFNGLIPKVINIANKMNWEGKVAHINGDRIYINAGRLSGIQIGDILKVSDKGDEIYDPQTGEYLGKAEGRLKGTLEVISYFGKDGAVTVVHSGANFKPNDKVELY